MEMTNDLYGFLIIGLSGLMAIETYRYIRIGHKRTLGDFELFGLSIFWGLVILFVFELIGRTSTVNTKASGALLQNAVAAGFILAVYGTIGGWLSALILNSRWLAKLIKYAKGLLQSKSRKTETNSQ